jgi:hypothetical protein
MEKAKKGNVQQRNWLPVELFNTARKKRRNKKVYQQASRKLNLSNLLAHSRLNDRHISSKCNQLIFAQYWTPLFHGYRCMQCLYCITSSDLQKDEKNRTR